MTVYTFPNYEKKQNIFFILTESKKPKYFVKKKVTKQNWCHHIMFNCSIVPSLNNVKMNNAIKIKIWYAFKRVGSL